MKNELRGRSIKDYDINYIADLRWIMDSRDNISDEHIIFVKEEYFLSYTTVGFRGNAPFSK